MLIELCLLLAAFFLGCIATEIRWIGKMRGLRGQVETELTQVEKTVSGNATDTGAHDFGPEVNTEQSLLGLKQHLAEKTDESPVTQGSREV